RHRESPFSSSAGVAPPARLTQAELAPRLLRTQGQTRCRYRGNADRARLLPRGLMSPTCPSGKPFKSLRLRCALGRPRPRLGTGILNPAPTDSRLVHRPHRTRGRRAAAAPDPVPVRGTGTRIALLFLARDGPREMTTVDERARTNANVVLWVVVISLV